MLRRNIFLLSPYPWYYRGLYPHPHGDTVDFVPIPVVLPSLLSPLPRYYRGYRGFTAVPIPMQLYCVVRQSEPDELSLLGVQLEIVECHPLRDISDAVQELGR